MYMCFCVSYSYNRSSSLLILVSDGLCPAPYTVTTCAGRNPTIVGIADTHELCEQKGQEAICTRGC